MVAVGDITSVAIAANAARQTSDDRSTGPAYAVVIEYLRSGWTAASGKASVETRRSFTPTLATSLLTVMAQFRCVVDNRWLAECIDSAAQMPVSERERLLDPIDPELMKRIIDPQLCLPLSMKNMLTSANKFGSISDIAAFVWATVLHEDLATIIPSEEDNISAPHLPLDFLPTLVGTDADSPSLKLAYVNAILGVGLPESTNNRGKGTANQPIFITGFFQVVDVIDIGTSVNSQLDSIVDDKPDDEGRRMVPLLDEESAALNMESSQADSFLSLGGENVTKSRKAGAFVRKMLQCTISDGRHVVQAIEVQRIRGFPPNEGALSIQMGSKMLLSNVPFRRGILLLDANNCFFVGGSVQAMNVDPKTGATVSPAERMEAKLNLIAHSIKKNSK